MTPAQQAKVQSWAEQRDLLLREIGLLTVERDSLVRNNKEQSESFSDLQKRISAAEARIAAHDEFVNKYEGTLSKEVSDLLSQKSKLESEVSEKKKEVSELEQKKVNLVQDIADSVDLFTKVAGKTEALEKIIDHVQEIGRSNINDIELLLSSLNKSVMSLIDLSDKNVNDTNKAISNLHEFLFKLQKPVPIRREGDPLSVRAGIIKENRSKK